MAKKIVFMGTSNFAVPILKSLYQNGYPIESVFTQPPRKSNRGQKFNKSPVHFMAETLNLNIRTPSIIKNNKDQLNYFLDLKPDLVIVVAYGQLIPKNILNTSKNGFINIHASLLPKWRGAAPIQRSIMNLDKETGISIMKMNENLDEGPICNNYKINVSQNQNAEDLSFNLAQLSCEKISENIDEILNNKSIFIEQNHSIATYAKKIDKTEGKINWNESADKIIGRINGLYPNPGAWFEFNSERHKILKAEKSHSNGSAGTVIGDELEVACGENSIKIIQIQRQGKRIQKISEFLLGSKIKKKTILK